MEIKLTYNGVSYTLGFNRESVKQLESTGFKINEIADKPATMIPMLFYGAFAKNHKGIKRKLVDEIFDNINGKTELIQVLGESYAETLSTILESESNEGNAIWEVVR